MKHRLSAVSVSNTKDTESVRTHGAPPTSPPWVDFSKGADEADVASSVKDGPLNALQKRAANNVQQSAQMLKTQGQKFQMHHGIRSTPTPQKK